MSTRLVVIGAGVAGLAAARSALARGADVLLLEASSRVGGLVETEHTADGVLVEHGPDCMVTMKPAGVRTAEALGLQGELVGGKGHTAYVLQRGRLHMLPTGLMAMSKDAGLGLLTSSLLSWHGKARLVFEPLVPRGKDADESVASFFGRRFGNEMVVRLVEPLFGGIYGHDTASLSLRAVMPQLVESERRHGSISRSIARRPPAPKPSGPPVPAMITLRRGMGALTDALAATIGPRVRTRATVRSIEHATHRGYRVRLADGSVVEADAVVVALPPWHAAAVTEDLDPELAALLGAVDAVRFDAVTTAWPRDEVPHALDGTGFVVAADDDRPTRACSWLSEKWPDRAPEGTALMRTFVRADGTESDEDIVDTVRRELRELLGVETPPRLVRVRRVPRALPRYEVGHVERALRTIERATSHEGLALAGQGVGGLGIPACIVSGESAAETALGATPRQVSLQEEAQL